MNRSDEMTALFKRVQDRLEPARWNTAWGAPPRRVMVMFADMQRSGYRLAYVQAEASGVGLFCREIVLRGTRYLEFTKGKQW